MRMPVSPTANNGQLFGEDIYLLKPPQLSKKTGIFIIDTYSQFDIKKQGDIVNADELYREKESDVGNVYIDKFKLVLKAIIRDASINKTPQISALILIENTESKESYVDKITNNTELLGYRLSIGKGINSQVVLIKDDEAESQKITLFMYK
jgi:hypothetical protein